MNRKSRAGRGWDGAWIKRHFMRKMIGIYAATSAVDMLAADCKDGACRLPSAGEAVYTVLSPVPESAVEPIAPAPRLKSLDGKAIALVGGSFMANVTHPELKRLILSEYPTAKVFVLSEIGSAGSYPRPGVVRREKDEFQRKLKEFKVDAVVSGNGGCGLCTPKETGSCVAAEALGIPSVMIAAPGFVKQAKSAAASAGLGELRVAEYPGAFAMMSPTSQFSALQMRSITFVATHSPFDIFVKVVDAYYIISIGVSMTIHSLW